MSFLLAKEEYSSVFRDHALAFEQLHLAQQGPVIYLPEATHAIPDSQGALAAQLVKEILTPNSRFLPGKRYLANQREIREIPALPNKP